MSVWNEIEANTFLLDSGQVCTASSRAYVQKSVAKEFKQLLVAGIKKLVMGPPSSDSTDLGPQADSTQAAAVAKYLELGNKEGNALVGGKKAIEFGDNYIQPTVFTDISDTSKINIEEVFGPVLILHEFETEEEVIRRANDTECTCSSPSPIPSSLMDQLHNANPMSCSQMDCTPLYSVPILTLLFALLVVCRPVM